MERGGGRLETGTTVSSPRKMKLAGVLNNDHPVHTSWLCSIFFLQNNLKNWFGLSKFVLTSLYDHWSWVYDLFEPIFVF